MDKLLTTQDFAKILKLCDSYLQKKYNTDLSSLMALNIDNKAETILMVLEANKDLRELFDNYNLQGVILDYIEEYSQKKIFKISDETLTASRTSLDKLTDEQFRISEERLHTIFKALEHNMELYDKLYRDKIWIMDSSTGRSEKITISPTRFFHLMGLDEKYFEKSDAMREFEKMFPSNIGIKSLMKDRKDLFQVLYEMVKREEDFINAISSGKLKSVINPQKMEMKNFGFERMKTLEHSSGMIFFDKDLAMRIAQSENAPFSKNIQSDLILLSSFIRNYDLEFIFVPYRHYRHNKKGLDAESLIIPEPHYEQARLYKGQQVSISERARQYSPKDFVYTIKKENGNEEPLVDPNQIIEFSDEDKVKMSKDIFEKLPQLDINSSKDLCEKIVDDANNRGRK